MRRSQTSPRGAPPPGPPGPETRGPGFARFIRAIRLRRPTYFAVAALVLLTGSGGSCSEQQREQTVPESAQLPAPQLRLLVLTDLDGYLEPCGCTSRPLGGIDRMAARVAALREDDVPTLMVMAGDVFFHGAPHGGDMERARDQELFRAETLREILDRLDVAAAAPGPLDFSFGADRFAALARASDVRWLAAGASIEGEEEPVLAPSTTVEVGGLTVGLVGFAPLAGADGATPDGVRVDDAFAAGRAAVEAMDADVVIALVAGDRRLSRRVARLDGVDFVVQGGLDQADANVPVSTDGAVILHAGRQGQGLVVADVHHAEGGWTDVSAWSREASREHLRSRIESLEARIEQWEGDDSVAEADLQTQRRRLASLRSELRALEARPEASGGYVDARYLELPPDSPRDDAIRQLMGRLDRRVNEHNRELFADWTPEPAPEGAARYVGSERCGTCHASAMTWWRGHPHGRAYATLETRHKNFNLSCVGCHVTGYLQPGGSTVTHTENLTNVGCESCHGPGSAHVSDPSGAEPNVVLAPEERTCTGCHNEEHSDTFRFDTYRQMVMVPGHGRPAD